MSVTTPKIYLTRNIDGLEYVLKSIHEEYVKTGDRNIEDLLGEISILEGFLIIHDFVCFLIKLKFFL